MSYLALSKEELVIEHKIPPHPTKGRYSKNKIHSKWKSRVIAIFLMLRINTVHQNHLIYIFTPRPLTINMPTKSLNQGAYIYNVPLKILIFKKGFLCVSLAVMELTCNQSGLEHRDPPASASPSAGISGMCHHTQLKIVGLVFFFFLLKRAYVPNSKGQPLLAVVYFCSCKHRWEYTENTNLFLPLNNITINYT